MTTRNYEAMFILENNAATADFDATAGKVDEILQKHGATLAQKEKWDERKLAYEIKGHRRGTYYLVYFEAPPTAIRSMNEDLGLTEVVLRHMMIALDLPIDDYIAKRATERERLAEDSRKNALGGWGSPPRRGGRGPEPRKPPPAAEGEAPKAPAEVDTPAQTPAEGEAPKAPAEGDKPAQTPAEGDASKPPAAESAAPAAAAEAPATDDQDGKEEAQAKEAASKP